MTNWKTKYLEMKLKYINKQKILGGMFPMYGVPMDGVPMDGVPMDGVPMDVDKPQQPNQQPQQYQQQPQQYQQQPQQYQQQPQMQQQQPQMQQQYQQQQYQQQPQMQQQYQQQQYQQQPQMQNRVGEPLAEPERDQIVNYSMDNGLLSVFEHSLNTSNLITSLVNLATKNNKVSKVQRLINIFINKQGDLFYSSNEFRKLQRTFSDKRVGNISQQETAAPIIMNPLNAHLKDLLVLHIQEILIKSQILKHELFTHEKENDCPYVMIAIDVYVNRSYGNLGFHHDSTTLFPSKFVWLSYENTEIMPGPEIISRSNFNKQTQDQLDLEYIRPGIPINGTILFNDRKIYHSTPSCKKLQGNIIDHDNLYHVDRQCLAGRGMNFSQARRTNLATTGEGTYYRHLWDESNITTLRNFIRGWIIPISQSSPLFSDLQNIISMDLKVNFFNPNNPEHLHTTSVSSEEMDQIFHFG